MNRHSIAAVLLAGAMALGVSACGDDDTTAPTSSSPPSVASSPGGADFDIGGIIFPGDPPPTAAP